MRVEWDFAPGRVGVIARQISSCSPSAAHPRPWSGDDEFCVRSAVRSQNSTRLRITRTAYTCHQCPRRLVVARLHPDMLFMSAASDR